MIKISKNNIEHICDRCGKLHYICISTYNKLQNGKQKNCYCSKECKSKSQMNGKEINCDYCNKLFYRKNSNINKEHNFCSTKCEFSYKHEKSIELRNCEFCNKTFSCSKVSTQRFCSHLCNSKWQSTRVGLLNPNYKRKEYMCDWCNKKIYVKRYKLNENSNLFCSNKCRQEWFANVYSQDENSKNMWRNTMINTLSNNKISITNSKPQQIIDDLLEKNNILYKREYNIKYYCIDNYLLEHNLMIEVMGDYWHCNPIKYNRDSDDIYKIQKENIRRDNAKRTYVKKYYDIEILYLWENDILYNINMCEKLIYEYINKSGVLNNYHSFNYHMDDDILKINDDNDIIII